MQEENQGYPPPLLSPQIFVNRKFPYPTLPIYISAIYLYPPPLHH
eukprot:gene11216-7788_t